MKCVGMCWNMLEWPMEWAGMGWNGLEWVGMGWNGPWNGLESVGMALGIWQNELGMCWNGIPLGFHQNPAE